MLNLHRLLFSRDLSAYKIEFGFGTQEPEVSIQKENN